MFKPKIQVVLKSDCYYCVLTKKLLTDYECDWKEDSSLFIPTKSYPQIFVENIYVGGYSELLNLSELWELNMFSPNKSYKPFKFPFAINITKLHENLHWVEDEISLVDDMMCWGSDELSTDERTYTINILKLFTQSDVSVGNLYYDIFIPLFQNNELRCMMGSFAAREGIHQRAYALLTDTLGIPDSIYKEFLDFLALKEKMDFMMEMKVDTLENIALSIVKAVFNEGVSLFSSFLMLLNFQRFGKMTGMGKVVEWSIRDESIHVQGMTTLFKLFINAFPFLMRPEFNLKIFNLSDALISLENTFIDLVFNVTENNPTGSLKIPQLSAHETKNFIKFILNRRLVDLGFYNPNYDIPNPVPWVTWIINGTDHTNFFENRVTEYSISGLTGSWNTVYVDE